MCTSVYINAYISQVPGDFLNGLQNSLLLTQMPTSTYQHVNDTQPHINMGDQPGPSENASLYASN